MSDNKKTRADAKLKTLPEDRQAQIAELCAIKTLAEVRQELAADGLVVSIDTISRWYSSWQLEQDFQRTETLAEQFMQQIKLSDPQITEEKLFDFGQTLFALRAVENKDARDWKRVQDVRHRRQMLDIERKRFMRETSQLFLNWFEDQRAKEIASASGLGQTEKIEKLGQLMFGDDWAPEASK